MKKSDRKTLSNSLPELLDKFAKNDVIASLEKQYSASPSKLISTSQIDDNRFVKKVKLKPELIDDFAKDILKNGIYSPLVVRPVGNHYELVLGRKRFYAGKKDSLTEFPCVIVDVADEECLLMLLADNRDQRDGNVVEMALVYRSLVDRFGYNHETLATLSHLSRSQVTNILRILKLSDKILDDISLGKLSYGHAKAIACLSDDDIETVLSRVYADGLSVRETERLVHVMNSPDEESLSTIDVIEKKTGATRVRIRKKTVSLSFANETDKEAFLNKLAK